MLKVHTNAVKKVFDENYRVKTIEIEHALEEALPGQFLMVWVPGIGERPMSIGNGYPLTISVANVGKVTAAMTALKPGDLISYRGPLGKPFVVPKDAKRILVVGGGYGVVPLYFLSKRAKENEVGVVAVVGARTAKDIIYEKRLLAACSGVLVTTDDGSRGKKGTVMAEAQRLIESKKFACVYACGPEPMMHAVALLCRQHHVPCQVSLERYMKCGLGVCGSCVVNGKTVCRDGPVFSGEEALAMGEFGKARRDATGALIERQ
jgi:dihydroorotate dehydrogenase electron transfer subunit